MYGCGSGTDTVGGTEVLSHSVPASAITLRALTWNGKGERGGKPELSWIRGGERRGTSEMGVGGDCVECVRECRDNRRISGGDV